MPILILTNTYPPADITGVGALAAELAAAFGSQGHEIRVLTRKAPENDPHAYATGGGKLAFPLRAALAFAGDRHAYDVLHVHESDGTLLVIVARLLRLVGSPRGQGRIVATLQVSYAEERRVVRPVRADGVIVARPTGSERVFAWLRAPLHALLGRVTARLADAVVAPSRVTASELERDYGARVAAVIPNGLAAPAASSEPAERAPGLILYAGRLRTRKAVAVLLAAFARVRAEVGSARLVVAGSGEQEPALRAQAERLGLTPEAVEFAGAVPWAQMAEYYRRAAVYCLPSTYEGFPVAILEAMAHGLPVVSTAVAGIPEAVIDGETGYVVPAEDAAALCQALTRLLTDRPLREKMGEAGRRRFDELYRVETVAAAYIDLYASLAARASAPARSSPEQR